MTARTRTTMMMMMMMMMVVCVSAASLGGSRRTDGKVEGFRENRENRGNVSTRLESHQDVNKTVEDSRSLKSHQDVNKTLDVSIRVTSHQDVNGTLENSTRVASRQDVNKTLEDSTRLDSHQDVNITLNNSTRDATLNPSRNETLMTPFILSVHDCPLSTCLTQNLGSALQRGDETAGRDASDPLGFGKK